MDYPGYESRQGKETFLFYKKSRPSPEIIHPVIQWVLGFFLGVKRPECEINSSSLTSDEVRNDWSYTSTPLLCIHGVDRDIFTLHSRSILITVVARYNIKKCIVFCCSNSGVVGPKLFRVWMYDGPIAILIRTKCLPAIFMNPEQLKTLDCLSVYCTCIQTEDKQHANKL